MTCPRCGSDNPTGKKFCGLCGARIRASAVAGVAVRERTDSLTTNNVKCFAILTDGVHRFEGTVNQYTGDGIMALFGAPIAHEDHAQRAGYAALALRDEIGFGSGSAQPRQDSSPDADVRLGLDIGANRVDELRVPTLVVHETGELGTYFEDRRRNAAVDAPSVPSLH